MLFVEMNILNEIRNLFMINNNVNNYRLNRIIFFFLGVERRFSENAY